MATHSSIGKGASTDKLSRKLNAEIEIHATYFIENNDGLSEPEALLQQKIEQVMKIEHDFVIIQIGSNEMSQLDLSEDKDKLFERVQVDCDKVIKLAKLLVENYDVEVFKSEKPPRYDKKVLEHGGILEGLNNTSNSILHMRSHLLDRVRIIKQSMLESKSDKVRADRFKPDGLHLTDKGLGLLTNNWIDQIKKVFPDMLPDVRDGHSSKQQGHDQAWGHDTGNHVRGGRGGIDQRRGDWGNSGRGRGNQGYGYQNRGYQNWGDQSRVDIKSDVCMYQVYYKHLAP